MATCAEELKEIFGEDLTAKQLDEILELLDRRAQTKRRNDPTMDEAQAFTAAAEDLAAERRLATLIEKRSRVINVIRKQKRQSFYENFDSESAAIRALNVGKEGPIYGAGRSVDAQKHGLEAEMIGPMINDLRKNGLLEVAVRNDQYLERDVAREMSRLNGRSDIESTGNKTAEKMAEIFVKYTEAGRVMQNEAGAFIRKLPGYVTRQSHDQLKIQKAGFEQWRERIMDKLDPRTFDDVDDVEEFMRAVYNNLASGNHLKAGGESDWLGGFKGPGNLAKRASAERVLHFKGPDEWLAYNNEFGRTSLFESVVDGLTFSARNTALMRTWGTNPEAAFRADLDQAIVRAKNKSDTKEVERLNNWRMQAEMNQLTNAVQVPGNVRFAQYSSGIRAMQSMSKLGGVVLSSIPDIAFRASLLRHNGVSLAEGYGSSLRAFFDGRNNTEKKEIADLMNAGVQGILGGVFERFHAADNVPGRMSKAQNQFFRISGLTLWTDAMSRGVALTLSRNLANQISAKRAFSDLNSRLQTTLRRYGIGEEEWSLISKADTRMADGERFLLADGVRSLSDEDIRAYMGKPDASDVAVRSARDELETKMSSYFTDQTRESMTFAGSRERAIQAVGTSSGTPVGEALRFMMQFKTFPITVIMRHVNRELHRGGKVDKAGLANLIVGSTILGYIAMNTKELTKGRDIRVPEDAESSADIMRAAMMQGGGLGIYGDFLLGETNRYGRSLTETALGPTASTANDVSKILSTALDGEVPTGEAFRAVKGITPGQNLFYTRAALDYLILWRMQEAMNPGYLRRYQRKVERDNNQSFWLPPTSASR